MAGLNILGNTVPTPQVGLTQVPTPQVGLPEMPTPQVNLPQDIPQMTSALKHVSAMSRDLMSTVNTITPLIKSNGIQRHGSGKEGIVALFEKCLDMVSFLN